MIGRLDEMGGFVSRTEDLGRFWKDAPNFGHVYEITKIIPL